MKTPSSDRAESALSGEPRAAEVTDADAASTADAEASLELSTEILTVDEAARLLRVNRKTLYEAIQRGEVAGVIRIRKAIRLSRSALLEWTSVKAVPRSRSKS